MDTQIFKKNWIQQMGIFGDDAATTNQAFLHDQKDSLSLPFIEIFRLFNILYVVKLVNWETVTFPGRFISLNDYNDRSFQLTISKWFYVVSIWLTQGRNRVHN
jgi:hypothetical protein